MSFIEIRNLKKSYQAVKAIKDISLDIGQGELFGFIGPDGAGKTTLFRIIATLLLPDHGYVSIDGIDVVREYRKIRLITGYMPGTFSLYQDLTIEENLRFFASIFNTTIEENYDLIKDIYSQIEPFKNRRAGKLSGGMKQKLALSCALIHKPRLLILDEPTTGVDAVSRGELWEMLKKLKDAGITIIVSTPYMDEAGLCDRIALVQDGSVLACRKPDELPELFGGKLLSINHENKYALIKALREYPGNPSVFPFGDSVHFSIENMVPDKDDLGKFLSVRGIQECTINEIKPGIEDVFMALSIKYDGGKLNERG